MLLSMIIAMPDKIVDHCPEYLFAFLIPKNRSVTTMCDTDTRELVNECGITNLASELSFTAVNVQFELQHDGIVRMTNKITTFIIEADIKMS